MIEYFQNSRQTIYMDDFVNIIVQITRLILYLHEEDIFGINISSNILLDKKGRVKLLSLELSNRILKSFQSKNQDIIDFGSIFKVIKFKDREYNKLLKDCINTRRLEDCINRLESMGRSTKGQKVEIVVVKK
ncbi:8919_t:CDS:2 [Rhizophagus irregularis]|nr:8919_t:CDS:2 [Rhizophagus irregularis]